MDRPNSLTSPNAIRAYLRAIDFSPGKSLGQNFLVDANIRDLILDASETTSSDTVIEVGPGLGVMTEGLLARARQVLAIELDARLVAHLHRWFGEHPTLTLRHADATDTDWTLETRPDPVRVISNLPYSVGSRVLYDLAAPAAMPVSITVMVQRDVADRLLAAPGDPNYGLLSVRMQWGYEIRRIRNVPGSCFLPPPRVGSSVVHLTRRSTPPVTLRDPETFEALVKFAFTRRRKQMTTILRDFGAGGPPENLDPRRRPETLSLSEWGELANTLDRAPSAPHDSL